MLKDLRNRGNQQQLKADFESYLDGFSPSVQTILTNFEFRNQIPRLCKADALGTLIEKFLNPELNLSPYSNGKPGLDNHAMGTIFEELVRKFNEDNNEEAGEHWTPRDAVKLMASLVFEPIKEDLQSGTYLIYDCACGTGGMLTVAEETLQEIARSQEKQIATHLFGQEINSETFAICKADMLLKGEGESVDNIIGGPEHSTLSNDAFPTKTFDFMLANPPYGKSWKTDLERMGGKGGIRDPRFVLSHGGNNEYSLLPRSSDGQLLFLANMASKMKHDTPLGSRIAEVHNGSSLFTGDAGQGESNIRRWIIENDWLEAIIALPLNLFYNTGIATYIWIVTNRKPLGRKGKVQLIDATSWFKPLRKNLGKKNCELSTDHINRILEIHRRFEETENSKIFDNRAFGYWKVTVERPLRLRSEITQSGIEKLRFASGDEEVRKQLYEEFGDVLFDDFNSIASKVKTRLASWNESDEPSEDDSVANRDLSEKTIKRILDDKSWKRDAALMSAAEKLKTAIGTTVFLDHNIFRVLVEKELEKNTPKFSSSEMNTLLSAFSERDETAKPVIAKIHKSTKAKENPIYGVFCTEIDGKSSLVEYETDSALRDTEQIPLLCEGGIDGYFQREIIPFAPDAWLKEKTVVGYEIPFSLYFYKPQAMRGPAEITKELRDIDREAESLIQTILNDFSASER